MTAKDTSPPVAASADDLLGASDSSLGEAVVPIPELGFSIKVRGLTRGEARTVVDSDDLTASQREARALSLAAVEPTFTEAQATQLLDEKSFGVTEKVLTKILELSGLTPGFR